MGDNTEDNIFEGGGEWILELPVAMFYMKEPDTQHSLLQRLNSVIVV